MKTTYRVIGFGEADYGFFNQPRYHSTLADATESFAEFYAEPEFDGAVVIEVEHETWRVYDSFGLEGKSVVYGPLGNFKVTKTPKLEMV